MQLRTRGQGRLSLRCAIQTSMLFCTALFCHVFRIRAGTAQEIYPFTSGAQPSGLIEGSDGAFYGTTRYGGDKGCGRVFRVTLDGKLTTIASFAGTNGIFPETGVILGPDGALYGTTSVGGTNSLGTVFRVTTNGDLTSLVSFSGNAGGTLGNYPRYLTLGPDGAIYGITHGGGTSAQGAAFRITTNGTFTSIASFSGPEVGLSDGLTLGADGNFYGAAAATGQSNHGLIYRMTKNGVRTTIAYFDGTNGFQPSARMILGDDGVLYGTTYFGGVSSAGSVFKCTTNGEITLIKSFDFSGGYYPEGILAKIGGMMYGTTQLGGDGPGGDGTVFELFPGGTVIPIFNFGKTNGMSPADLIAGSDGALYGCAGAGGPSGEGTVYRITTSGVLTTLATFSDNGNDAEAGLVQADDGNFYGATSFGGEYGRGTIFRVNSNGLESIAMSLNFTNGANPDATLVRGNDGSLYGTTPSGGLNNYGTAFRMETNGAMTAVVSFPSGSRPIGSLAMGTNGFFYGVTSSGGVSGAGTIFRLSTNCDLTFVAAFNYANGALPQAGLTLGPDGAFYGTTGNGGNQSGGTVFKFTTDGIITALASFDPAGGKGRFSRAPLTLGLDGYFYGTTFYTSNTGGNGTVFRISPSGVMSNLVVFPGFPSPVYPTGPLVLGSDGAFYGSTISGGDMGFGCLYRVTTNGLWTVLVSFNSITGSGPKSGVVLGRDGRFYGTTSGGGKFSGGNVFAANLIPRMRPLIRAGVDWFIDFEGIALNTYRVQRATSPSGPWSSLGSWQAGVDGVGHYVDFSPPPSAGFYRVVYP